MSRPAMMLPPVVLRQAALLAALVLPATCVAADQDVDQTAAQAAQPEAQPNPNHPLAPVLRMAEQGLQTLRSDIRDYTCLIVKRERRGGKLKPYQFINAKVRHEDKASGVPFSVYLNFAKPDKVAGREVLYLEGRNAGKMLVRRGGRRLAYVTTFVDPTSPLALQENRYPVTQIGFLNVIEHLADVMREDMRHGECEVKFFKDAKVGDTACTRIVVEHPKPRKHFRFHRAVVFIDENRNLPIAYGSYTWPEKPGGKPVLVEEYIHANIKLNVGLTDQDFSRENPKYGFLRRETEAIAAKD